MYEVVLAVVRNFDLLSLQNKYFGRPDCKKLNIYIFHLLRDELVHGLLHGWLGIASH